MLEIFLMILGTFSQIWSNFAWYDGVVQLQDIIGQKPIGIPAQGLDFQSRLRSIPDFGRDFQQYYARNFYREHGTFLGDSNIIILPPGFYFFFLQSRHRPNYQKVRSRPRPKPNPGSGRLHPCIKVHFGCRREDKKPKNWKAMISFWSQVFDHDMN